MPDARMMRDECESIGCTRTPAYDGRLCRECYERLLSREFRTTLWARKVPYGVTARSVRMRDDAEI